MGLRQGKDKPMNADGEAPRSGNPVAGPATLQRPETWRARGSRAAPPATVALPPIDAEAVHSPTSAMFAITCSAARIPSMAELTMPPA